MVVKPVVAVLAAALLGAMVACGGTKQPPAEAPPAYTYAEAVKMVEDILYDVTQTMNPRPRLEVAAGGDSPCAGPDDDKPTDRVMYEKVYWLRSVPHSHNAGIVDQLKQYYATNGYLIGINDMNDVAGIGGVVVATSPTTGFKLKLEEAINDDLSLTAQSPCVTERSLAPS